MADYKWGKQPAHTLYLSAYLHHKGPALWDLAELLHIPHTHLENVMYGRTRPSPETIRKLEQYFGKPAPELFTLAVREEPYDASKPGPGVGVVRRTHKNCDHPCTPAARRYCRLGQSVMA